MDTTTYVQAREKTIITTVTANPNTIADWIDTVTDFFRPKPTIIFGLDVEWRPSWGSGYENPVATLQLCAGNRCLIVQLFQLVHIDYAPLPHSLHQLFTNPRHMFAGVGIADDVAKLQAHYGLTIENLFDIRDEARQSSSGSFSQWPGLRELARVVAGVEIEKPRRVTVSNWEEQVLSDEQIKYACLDAYASCQVAVVLYFGLRWG